MANILLYSLDTTSISNGKDILVVFVIRKNTWVYLLKYPIY